MDVSSETCNTLETYVVEYIKPVYNFGVDD